MHKLVGLSAQPNFGKRIKGLVSKVLRRKPNGLKPFFENEENDLEILSQLKYYLEFE